MKAKAIALRELNEALAEAADAIYAVNPGVEAGVNMSDGSRLLWMMDERRAWGLFVAVQIDGESQPPWPIQSAPIAARMLASHHLRELFTMIRAAQEQECAELLDAAKSARDFALLVKSPTECPT